MIDEDQAHQHVDRRQRRLIALALAAGALVVVALLVRGVVAWGWLATVAAFYAVSVLVSVALFVTENRLARRASAQEPEDR